MFVLPIMDIWDALKARGQRGINLLLAILTINNPVFGQTCRDCHMPPSGTDHFARWGGDEFMIIAPETPLEGAQQLAEKIRQALEKEMFPTVGHLTASVGLTSLAPGDNAESLVRRTDRFLLASKEEGRNRVSVGPHTPFPASK